MAIELTSLLGIAVLLIFGTGLFVIVSQAGLHMDKFKPARYPSEIHASNFHQLSGVAGGAVRAIRDAGLG